MTAFDPEELIEKTNELPRTDKRDAGVVKYANGLVDTLGEAEPRVKAALDALQLETIR